jgi:dethiobiotin synthetase
MRASFFITSPGTGQGKTLITAALAYQLREKGHSVAALKPVISGFNAEHPETDTDSAALLRALELPITPPYLNRISPWRFTAPLAPDEAARLEGKNLNPRDVEAYCTKTLKEAHDITLIEGAGGVLSPLASGYTNRDLIASLKLPVILVSGSYLGAISHILTAIEALESRSIPIRLVVLTECCPDSLPLDTLLPSLLPLLTPELRIVAIKHLVKSPQLWKNVPDLTQALNL